MDFCAKWVSGETFKEVPFLTPSTFIRASYLGVMPIKFPSMNGVTKNSTGASCRVFFKKRMIGGAFRCERHHKLFWTLFAAKILIAACLSGSQKLWLS